MMQPKKAALRNHNKYKANIFPLKQNFIFGDAPKPLFLIQFDCCAQLRSSYIGIINKPHPFLFLQHQF